MKKCKEGEHDMEVESFATNKKTMEVLMRVRCKKCGYTWEKWYTNISEVPDHV
jgi:predicted Zn-ribbon and HTH transcriptional regulator